MRLSEVTFHLLQRLYGLFGYWPRAAARHVPPEVLIDQLGTGGRADAIPYLLPFVLAADQRLASKAASTIAGLLSAVTLATLPQLDEAVRGTDAWNTPKELDWHALRPEGLAQLEALPGADALLALATFHRNGRVREAAIRRLAAKEPGRAIPFLLIRLNDWVAEVRSAASEALDAWLVPTHADTFVASLPLALRLADATRSDHSLFLERLWSLLREPECRAMVEAALVSEDRLLRRQAYRILIDAVGADRKVVLEWALRDSDTMVRLWAARQVRLGVSDAELARFLPTMRGDPFMPVRREALQAIAEWLPDQAKEAARGALLDGHASMRELGRFLLRQRGWSDFAGFYRGALKPEAPAFIAALRGLAETGTQADAELVIPYLAHPSPRVVAAGVMALARLDPEREPRAFLGALQDDRPRVAHAARDALQPKMRRLDAEAIWRVLEQDPRPHVRADALRLLENTAKWDAAYYVTAAIGLGEAEAAAARLALERWLAAYNKNFSVPAPAQLARVRALLDALPTDAVDENCRELRAILETWAHR